MPLIYTCGSAFVTQFVYHMDFPTELRKVRKNENNRRFTIYNVLLYLLHLD